jgi:hypothetical protein
MKMVHKRIQNGSVPINIWVNGSKIRKTALEFSIIKMEINFKEDGQKINVMDKARNGLPMGRTNYAVNSLVIGLEVGSMVEELCFSKMEIDMTVFGLMIRLMDKVE